VRFSTGGRALERLAGSGAGPSGPRVDGRWRTVRSGPDPWEGTSLVDDQPWLRGRRASLVREGLQQALLFPTVRLFSRPRVNGADELAHAPQPAVIAPNHASDVDTPLVLASLPRAWRERTVVGAAADRFYRRRRYALLTGLWINTFPFDRSGELRGLADAAEFLRDGYNVLLYPQGTRSSGLEGFRSGVARLCALTGAPLLPVHVQGTAMIMPKDRGLTQRGTATVTFGRPLYARPDEDAESLTRRASEAISRLQSSS
jgi:1-acyl-sn-glycerol-3-phosphate acyltransferase